MESSGFFFMFLVAEKWHPVFHASYTPDNSSCGREMTSGFSCFLYT
jgi:hypothetical protein